MIDPLLADAVTGLGVSAADQFAVLGLVLVAAVLGAALGAEREMANKSAGMRTHMLVASGAALVVGVGDLIIHVDDGVGDASRTLHGVITGIGFLGAGAIIRHNDATIEGLTTAASLWFAGAVGAAAGLGVPILAAGVTALGFLVLRVVGKLEVRWDLSEGDDRDSGRPPPDRGADDDPGGGWSGPPTA